MFEDFNFKTTFKNTTKQNKKLITNKWIIFQFNFMYK